MLVNLEKVAIVEDEGIIIPGHGRLIVEDKLEILRLKMVGGTSVPELMSRRDMEK